MPRLAEVVRKLRGLTGVSTLGALSGAGVAGVMGVGRHLLGMGFASWGDVLGFTIGGTLYGAACGLGFGLVLIAFESGRSIQSLPLWRMGGLGALMGAAVPIGYMLLTSGLFHFLYAPEIVVSVAGSGAVLGGLVSAGLVALATRAAREELASADDEMDLIR